MNQTLDRIQSIIDQTASEKRSADEQRLADVRCLAEAAEPLLKAYDDLENQLVRIAILKQLWPKDFDRRGDRVSALLIDFISEQGLKYGLRFRVPSGQVQFFVELRSDGEPVYMATSSVGDGRSKPREFADRDDWLRYFLGVIGPMIELPK